MKNNTCYINPLCAHEHDPKYYPQPAAEDEKKIVMIAGAGPAGMECAYVAAQRGHEVHIYDKRKLMGLAQNYAGQWINQGALVKLEKGEKPFEVFLKWERCPWPTYAKEYGVPMEEDVRCCDKILQSVLQDVNIFFNVRYNIETLKAIPRGHGVCLRKLYEVG